MNSDGEPQCVLCDKKIVKKTFNVKRHFEQFHSDFASKLPEDIQARKNIFDGKMRDKSKQSSSLASSLKASELSTLASCQVAELILKYFFNTFGYNKEIISLRSQKPFAEGDFIKECLLQSMETILKNRKEKVAILSDIKDIPLSRMTITRRAELIANCIRQNMRNILKKNCEISLCLDESTDICDMSQLIIWIRICHLEGQTFDIIEEILDLQPLTDTTTAQDIFTALKKTLSNFDIDICKISAITTDGAPSMVGRKEGLAEKMRRENPKLINFHCLIHQENLTAKMGIPEAKKFSDFVMKIVNLLISGSSLKHRQFKNFLEQTNSELDSISKMNQVRWLSVEKTLNQFIKVVGEIKLFLNSMKRPIEIPELSDVSWLGDLAFFADLTAIMGELNRKLQSNNLLLIIY